jgi:hypothetical protein
MMHRYRHVYSILTKLKASVQETSSVVGGIDLKNDAFSSLSSGITGMNSILKFLTLESWLKLRALDLSGKLTDLDLAMHMMRFGDAKLPTSSGDLVRSVTVCILAMNKSTLKQYKDDILLILASNCENCTLDLFESDISPILKCIWSIAQLDRSFQAIIHNLYFESKCTKVLQLLDRSNFLFIQAYHQIVMSKPAEAREVLIRDFLTFPMFTLLLEIIPDLKLDTYKDIIFGDLAGEFMFQYLQQNKDYFIDCLYNDDADTLEYQLFSGLILINMQKTHHFEVQRIFAVLYDKVGKSVLLGIVKRYEMMYTKMTTLQLSVVFQSIHCLLETKVENPIEDVDLESRDFSGVMP